MVATTFAGAFVAATVEAYVLFSGIGYHGPDPTVLLPARVVFLAFGLVLVGGVVAVILIGALLALYVRFHATRGIGMGLVWVGLGLVIGGPAGLALAIAYAGSTGYSNASSVMLSEILIVIVGCLLGIAAGGQVWLWRRRSAA